MDFLSFGVRATSRDDADHFLRILLPICVSDNKDNNLLNRADCLPSLFNLSNPLNERDAEGIVENELRLFQGRHHVWCRWLGSFGRSIRTLIFILPDPRIL